MENLPDHIRQLLISSALGELSISGEQDLSSWMKEHPECQCLLDAVNDKRRLSVDITHLTGSGNGWEASYNAFASKHLRGEGKRRLLGLKFWYPAAASILILIMVGLGIFQYYAGFKSSPDESILAARPLAEVLLGNGQKIQLGNNQGTASQRVDTSWYQKIAAAVGGDSAHRTAPLSFRIVTPKGGKYALALPDGSRVWMSAASSLSYNQNDGERQVDMEGEVYFEIAKQSYQKNGKTAWRPFKVHAKDMEVEVWGTRFTVSSYPGSNSQTTTLFEGKVKVSTGEQNLFLTLGQRADLKGGVLTKQPVDNSQGVALKEGYFIFKAATLSDILTEVGNWYNVNIIFQDDQIGQQRFEAMLPRSARLADLLNALEGTGDDINFTFKGRTIYVDKK